MVHGWMKKISGYDPNMTTALQHGTWMDEKRLKDTLIKQNDEICMETQ